MSLLSQIVTIATAYLFKEDRVTEQLKQLRVQRGGWQTPEGKVWRDPEGGCTMQLAVKEKAWL